jgi:hypothetical protein
VVDRKTVAENVALVIISALVVFAGLEVALQAGVLSDPGLNQDSFSTEREFCDTGIEGGGRYVQHPVYGWVGNPNAEYVQLVAPDQEWERYTHTETGFRDTFNDGNQTAIVLGDSLTYGFQVDDNETYSRVLDESSDRLAVRNHGIGGYSTAQELLLYRNLSERVEHEVVIVGYYMGNDATDNLNGSYAVGYRRPQFEITNNGLVQTKEPGPANSTPASTESSEPPLARDRIDGYLPIEVMSDDFISLRLERILAGDQRRQPPTGERLNKEMELTNALLDEISSESDATVMIVAIPERGEIQPNRPSRFHKSNGQAYWDAQRKMLRNVEANNSNVEVIFTADALNQASKNHTRVYGKFDGHLDDYGHYVIADELHDTLRESGHVRQDSRIVNYTESNEDHRCAT